MANTYTQIYIQIVFVVKRRENLILKEYREDVEAPCDLLYAGSYASIYQF